MSGASSLPFANVWTERQFAGRVIEWKCVVIVVESFAQSDTSDPCVVRRWNGSIVLPITPQVGGRIDEPRAMQDIAVPEDVRHEEGDHN